MWLNPEVSVLQFKMINGWATQALNKYNKQLKPSGCGSSRVMTTTVNQDSVLILDGPLNIHGWDIESLNTYNRFSIKSVTTSGDKRQDGQSQSFLNYNHENYNHVMPSSTQAWFSSPPQ